MAIGVHNGYDLSTSLGLRRAMALVRDTKPKYLHVSPPCGPWSSLQNANQGNPNLVKRLHEQRLRSRRLLKNCCKLVALQRQEVQRPVGVCFEEQPQPLRATSWQLPEMKEMLRLCGATRFQVDGCRHGLKDPQTGVSLRKPWGWFSSSPKVRQVLARKCNHEAGTHEQIQGGRRAAQTATYPYLLCRRFAKAILQESYHGEVTAPSQTLWRSSEVFVGDSEAVADDEPMPDANGGEPVVEDIDPEGDPEENGFRRDPEIKRKLTLVHRNLGHPSKQVLLRMLRDAGASAEVLAQAEHFECAECRQRGRRGLLRPATVTHYTQKWTCMSIDTFWWHTPKEALQPGEKPQHMLCLSMLDEACDYHVVQVIRQSENGPLSNMTGPEFKRALTIGWLRFLAAPQVLRYDEAGFLKRLDVIEWLEGLGVKLEPVAGESPWQIGKHSKHIQTLKDSMNLLCMEMQNQLASDELLSLSVSAKNNLHNIRGFSPNQWALGQSHSRVTSLLQQSGHLPNTSAREDVSFEEALQNECKAQRMFLEADSRRRIQRALRAQGRPIRDFECGELVYYFRRGRKEGSRYGGHWYGPARVVCHEKTSSDEAGGQAPGSVVWVSHAGKILRCSPEQLRRVTTDLKRLDFEVNGEWSFSKMFEQIRQQQRYLDITVDLSPSEEEHEQLHEPPTHRVRGKQRPPQPPEQSSEIPIEGSDIPPDLLDSLENGQRGTQALGRRPQADEPRGARQKQEADLASLRNLSPEKADKFVVTVGKYKGKEFQHLYKDSSYVSWIMDHVAGKDTTTSYGVKQILILLEVRLTHDLPEKAKGVSTNQADMKAATGSEESPGKAKPLGNSNGKRTNPVCQHVEPTAAEMEEWTNLEIQETLQADVYNLGQRMNRIEDALSTIIGEMRKANEGK